MTTLTFDTHDFVKKLKGAGFSEEQAEVLTDLQKVTVSNALEQVYLLQVSLTRSTRLSCQPLKNRTRMTRI